MIAKLGGPKSSEPQDYSRLLKLGALATGMAVYSLSTVICNTDHMKPIVTFAATDIAEGTMKKVQVGDSEDNYILISCVEGKYYATGGKCSHYGGPLQMGFLDGHSLICPLHGAAFDVRTGECIQAPGLDSIPTYPVSLQVGQLVVHIPEDKLTSVSARQPSKKFCKRDPQNTQCFVVVGGGAAGISAVETLRKEGFTGRIVMLTNERHLPYDRVVLSKNFKADSSKLELRGPEFFKEYGIEIESDAEVQKIDADSRVISLRNGKTVSYDKVLLATGSGSRVTADYQGYKKMYSNVFTLRSADSHTMLKEAVAKGSDIVIIGAGFIGLEAATSIKRAWPDKNVTIVNLESEPMSKVLGAEIAHQLVTAQAVNGVNLLLGKKIDSLNGDQGLVTSLSIPGVITFGGRPNVTELKADVVLLATGAEINTSYVPHSLKNGDGSVRVNSHLQTADTAIYAAGDIAQFPSLLTESRERVEHWAVAQQQGRIAALNMMEKGNNYTEVPFFWSNQFLNVAVTGFSTGHDWSYTETKDEDLPSKTARITYFYKGNTCIGAAAVNWFGAVLKLRIALQRGLMPTKKELTSKKVTFDRIAERVKNSHPCGANCCRN